MVKLHTDKKPEQQGVKNDSLKTTMGLLWPIYYQHRNRLAIGMLALLGVDFLQLQIPRILKKGIDGLTDGTATQSNLLHLALLICFIGLLATLLRFAWRYLIIGFSRHLERDLRKNIFSHIMNMDSAFFNRYSTGSIMAHSSNDLAAVQMACGMGLVAAVDACVMTIAAIFFMINIHPQLTIIALLPMPILAFATRFLSGRMHHRFNRVQEQFSLMTEFARSSIASIRLLKTYTLEKSQTKRFEKLGKEYVQSSIRVATIQGLLFPVATLVGSSGMLLVLWFGGNLVMHKTISMGDFVAFVTYLYMLIWPIMAVGWVANLSQRGITSLKRINLLLAGRSSLPPGISGIRHKTQNFSLTNLSFGYPLAKRNILDDITLEITPGILAVTGPTGCGKTTLCQLIGRMLPVDDRTLFLGDYDINDLPPQEVQSLISYVSQEAFLFSNSVAENIGFGAPHCGLNKIKQAARIAQIHDEIMTFPAGYDTLIGEKGVNLSGGQRQRVALARALVCDRPILIIDDGLAAVDTVTEQKILDGLIPRLCGKTVVWVSQRVKQLAVADRLLILDQGRISDLGCFNNLIIHNSFLREINHRQSLQDKAFNHA